MTTRFDPQTPMVSPLTGSINFGEVTAGQAAVLGIMPGPIRVLSGNRSFGFEHIDGRKDRVSAIKARGYKSVLLYLADVALNWSEVHPTDEPKRMILKPDGLWANSAIIAPQLGFWSIVTALPYRMPPTTALFVRSSG